MNGFILLDKGEGLTSQAAVTRVKHLFGAKKAGHTGTLDPMATGLLPILLDGATRAGEFLLSSEKHYEATLRLGITTDTEDTTGTVLTESKEIPTQAEVEAILPRFRGTIQQIPPMYSALKVNGQKLVDLARKGITVEREPREIEIFSLEIQATDQRSDYILDVTCSGGTYIRTLCADIGAVLGCGGAMATLERREACGFPIAQAHTVAELEAMTEEERHALLIPTEALFSSLPAICLPAFYERLFRSGCAISLKKLKEDHSLGMRVRVCDASGNFFALGEIVDDERGLAVKSVKMFVL